MKESKRFTVVVRPQGSTDTIETIKRALIAEMWGNFNPIYCRYKGKKYLVKSEEGDLSDPFRRTESYSKSLYIEVTP